MRPLAVAAIVLALAIAVPAQAPQGDGPQWLLTPQ